MSTESGVDSQLMTIKATGVWQFGFSSRVILDNLEVTDEEDETVEYAPEINMAVASLVGCTCAAVSAVARETGFYHNGLDFVGHAEFKVDSLDGESGAVRRFKAVRGTVTLRTDEDQERLDNLAFEVRKRCQVFSILENAGITPQIEWKKAASF